MNENKIFALLQRFWDELNSTEFYWLLAALAAILCVSWWLAYHLRRGSRYAQDKGTRNALLAFGTGGVERVAYPLMAFLLVGLLHWLLDALDVGHLALLSVASLLLSSWVLARIFVYTLRGVFPHGGFLTNFERFTSFAVWGCMILRMTGLSDPLIAGLERVSFNVGRQKLDLWMLLQGSVTVCVTLLAALWIASLIERRLLAVREIDANVREVLSRLAKALLSVLALLLSLSLLGIDVTALSVFSGALAVGLGLGLQRIASNYVSGFILLLDRSIRLGSLIALDDTTSGTVTRITTRYTVLRTLSGTEVIIPNEYLVSNMVRNLSFSDNRVRAAITVGVAYDTDVERVMKLMTEIALAHPRVLADPAPGVQLKEFADSAIVLELGFWVGDPERGTGGIRSDLNLEILRAFRKQGVAIPFPQREVRVLPNDQGETRPDSGASAG
ncbi:MAG: mechanosensitive ion channel [Candidatus Accumulibacter sp.]|jgi:small-conductance mechanosensitive channel|nr:mechanosensitive ion channel [Accumulibacter sp.]